MKHEVRASNIRSLGACKRKARQEVRKSGNMTENREGLTDGNIYRTGWTGRSGGPHYPKHDQG